MDPSPEPTPRLRLPLKKHRMHGADFKRAYSRGGRAKGALLTVVVAPNGLSVSRYGLSVGKRCWKLAVHRNRVRRVFRESFRLSLPELEPGFDYVFVSSTPRLEAHLAPVRSEFLYLARKAVRRYRERQARR